MPKSGEKTRAALLDAASRIVQQRGVEHLTLDLTAQEAGVSKGGLLYHFASKELLLRGVVEHHMAEHQRDLDLASTQFPPDAGGYLQAFVHAQSGELRSRRKEPGVTQSFIAAAVNTPDLMDLPRQQARAHIGRLRALGPDFIDALLMTLALDGLFFGDTFEMLDLAEAERERLLEVLAERAKTLAARRSGET